MEVKNDWQVSEVRKEYYLDDRAISKNQHFDEELERNKLPVSALSHRYQYADRSDCNKVGHGPSDQEILGALV